MNNDNIWLENISAEITGHPSENSIVSQRFIAYPVEAVFKAWTTAEHHKNWWGPAGFTNTFHVYEPRPGGTWSFVMHGPNGANYPNESVFVSVDPLRKLVFNHLSAPQFQGIATFEAEEDGTKLTYEMVFRTPEIRESLRPLITGANEENFDRLEVELERMRG